MSDILHAIVLGAIQGVTEFLPISSSGHLLIARQLFNWGDVPFLFDVFLHCATLIVIVHLLRHQLMEMIKRPRVTMRVFALPILVTTTVTAAIGVLLARIAPIGSIRLTAVGYGCTTIVSIIALRSFRFRQRASVTSQTTTMVNWRQATIIGLFQGIAVIPGVSRAGMTIIIARLCGVEKHRAFEYSFLVSIPTILGALLYQLASHDSSLSLSGTELLLGSAVAIVSGALSLRLLRYLNLNDRIGIFVPYVLFLSILCFIL